eukprot:jgi/Chrzof1/4155/Cz14g01040.t1
MLSQNTTDVTSLRAFTSLKQRFPTWEHVRTAGPGTVEDAIRVGGLAEIKVQRIRTILDTLVQERGNCCLEHLRDMSEELVKQQLTRFKGVGMKTAACVLMFCLQRAEFPVDTHVWEISKQLGWVPAKATRDQTYEHLNQMIPDDLKYDLHVLLVEHGKRCPWCAKTRVPSKRPAGQLCPLASFKASSKHSKATSMQSPEAAAIFAELPDTDSLKQESSLHASQTSPDQPLLEEPFSSFRMTRAAARKRPLQPVIHLQHNISQVTSEGKSDVKSEVKSESQELLVASEQKVLIKGESTLLVAASGKQVPVIKSEGQEQPTPGQDKQAATLSHAQLVTVKSEPAS